MDDLTLTSALLDVMRLAKELAQLQLSFSDLLRNVEQLPEVDRLQTRVNVIELKLISLTAHRALTTELLDVLQAKPAVASKVVRAVVLQVHLSEHTLL